MKYVLFLKYLLLNLVGINRLPCSIKYQGMEWYSFEGQSFRHKYVCYFRYSNNNLLYKLFEVRGECAYTLYLRVVIKLFRYSFS